ncbi:MAG: S1 RNA-binding domain-containing protein [Oscillospiraceae bacterium]|nr:S1 RNA-binding domain-containing protein [Oscillospiraceae bacterium]
MNNYKPEGCNFRSAHNQRLISTIQGLKEAMENGFIAEARAIVCDSSHNLIVELPCGKAVIPRTEGALGINDGSVRDIALISRVNKIVCFKVVSVQNDIDENGFCAVLSRRLAQEECSERYISSLAPGDVIGAKVTHLEQFGCFVDIGCGIPSLIPIDMISVSRISHPSDRFRIGEEIRAVVKANDGNRIFLTHKELLGTWEENAACFKIGETVSGIVRSIENYGIFVELSPNLAGLAEPREGLTPGQNISVYIKAIIPDKMKIKLIIVDVCGEKSPPSKGKYFFEEDHMKSWQYAPEKCGKNMNTVF